VTPLLGFAPDLEAPTPGVLVDCSQFIPYRTGFEAARDGATPTDVPALAAECRGAAVVTSYKLKWEFAGRTGTWDVARTLNTGQSASTGNVMYPSATTTWPQTFKVSVVSVNGQPDNNPANDVGTCVVNAM